MNSVIRCLLIYQEVCFTSSPELVFFRWFFASRYGRAEWPAPSWWFGLCGWYETPSNWRHPSGFLRSSAEGWNSAAKFWQKAGLRKRKPPKIGHFWYHGALNSLTHCTRNCDWRPTVMSTILLQTHHKGCRGMPLMDKTWQNPENR